MKRAASDSFHSKTGRGDRIQTENTPVNRKKPVSELISDNRDFGRSRLRPKQITAEADYGRKQIAAGIRCRPEADAEEFRHWVQEHGFGASLAPKACPK